MSHPIHILKNKLVVMPCLYSSDDISNSFTYFTSAILTKFVFPMIFIMVGSQILLVIHNHILKLNGIQYFIS